MRDCCEAGVPSLFRDNCKGLAKVSSRVMFHSKLDRLGNRNFIDTSVKPIPASVITGLVKNTDGKKRYAITPVFENPTWVRNENNVQTYDGGGVVKLSDGTTVMSFMVPQLSPQQIKAYENLECSTYALNIVTVTGQLMGYASLEEINNGELYGLPIQNISVIGQAVDTNTTVSGSVVTVTFEKTLDLGKVVVVDASEIGIDMNSVLEPKTAVLSVVTAATSTTTTISVNTEFYGINGAYPIEGLTASDFVVTDLPSTVVTPTSVVETSEGEYTFVYTGVTAGDNLRIDLSPTVTANLISGGAVTQTI